MKYILTYRDEWYIIGNNPKELIYTWEDWFEESAKGAFDDGILFLYELGSEVAVQFKVEIVTKSVPVVPPKPENKKVLNRK